MQGGHLAVAQVQVQGMRGWATAVVQAAMVIVMMMKAIVTATSVGAVEEEGS